MSQITCCPECHTRFKVVDDQLRISGGWVRCGKCKAVFDAPAHLWVNPAVVAAQHAQSGPETVPAAPHDAAGSPPVQADTKSEEPSAVLVTGNSIAIDSAAAVPELSVLVFPRRAGLGDSVYVDSTWKDSYLEPLPDPAPSQPQHDFAVDAQSLESEWDEAERPPDVRIGPAFFSAHEDMKELHAREERLLSASASRSSDAGADGRRAKVPAGVNDAPPLPQENSFAASRPSSPRSADTPPPPSLHAWSASEDKVLDSAGPLPDLADGAAAADVLVGVQAAPADEPRFVRDARRKAFWSRPLVLVASLLLALLLALALLVQWGIQQRDGLVAKYPEARAVLEPLCTWAGCQIAPVRQIDHVLIDSTGFRKIAPRQFDLTVVLRNQAAYAVATPALELALNDSAEKLLIRKVLLPAELGAPTALPAHGEWTASAVVQVDDNAAEVAGYRVLAFYP